MYERIASNVRKTWLLIGGFVLLVVAVGWVFGEYIGVGYWGVGGASVLAILMTWGSYFRADKIALAMSRAKPADETRFKQLHNIVESLSLAAGMPKPRVYVVEDTAPNAFATGRNPEHAAIAVTTGLMEKLTRDELEGVIAHELSHIKNRDTLVMTIAVTLVGVIVLLADWFLRAMWWGGGRGRDRGGGAGPILAIVGLVLMIFAPIIAQLMQMAVSRRREFLADMDGAFLTRYPQGLIGALEKLKEDQTVVRSASRATAHLWIEEPTAQRAGERGARRSGAWLNRLFATHPPLDERIAALRSVGFGAGAGSPDSISTAGAMPPDAVNPQPPPPPPPAP
ncbi:MAG: M48 family metalloprotease [Actinobacteria bacterium]|nr:M48 family metalloprotease [Actinomycetota bacterium]